MSITLFLCFPKERGGGDRKGRGPPALRSWGAPPCSAVGPAACSLSPAQSPSCGTHPGLQNSPEPPRLAVGTRSSCLVSELRLMRVQHPVSSESQERGGRGGRACHRPLSALLSAAGSSQAVFVSSQGERHLLSLNASGLFPRDRFHLDSKETKG